MNNIADAKQFEPIEEALSAVGYQVGFGNEFETEAVAGALPKGQNSPQRVPLGLYSELVTGAAFYAPRHLNRRSYTFRIRPSIMSAEFEPLDNVEFRTPPLDVPSHPGRLRWGPLSQDGEPADFLEGLTTLCGGGSPSLHAGLAVHFFRANRSMENRAFSNADGEFLILPQQGDLRIVTEFGVLEVEPSELVLIPRGVKFRVELKGAFARGLVIENYGHPWILPELGLIGSNGLANAIDFQAPVAHFEDEEVRTEVVHKHGGKLWSAYIDHSPFDVVAWRGSLTPFKYDMRKFVAIGSTTLDHPDPSIFCALASPAHEVSGCNADFMILPPRWLVGDHTLHLPGFHRNSVTEITSIMGGLPVINGVDLNGSVAVTNHWCPHGPDAATFEAKREASDSPEHINDLLLIMVETRYPLEFTRAAIDMKMGTPATHGGSAGYRKRFPNG